MLIFFTSDRLGRNFPTAQNGLEKRKNLYSIKLAAKWKTTIRKGLFNFSFLVFEIGANRFSVKFCTKEINLSF